MGRTRLEGKINFFDFLIKTRQSKRSKMADAAAPKKRGRPAKSTTESKEMTEEKRPRRDPQHRPLTANRRPSEVVDAPRDPAKKPEALHPSLVPRDQVVVVVVARRSRKPPARRTNPPKTKSRPPMKTVNRRRD